MTDSNREYDSVVIMRRVRCVPQIVILRERPQCRAVIKRRGLRPVYKDGIWDGHSCVDSKGASATLSKGLAAQMRKMIATGEIA